MKIHNFLFYTYICVCIHLFHFLFLLWIQISQKKKKMEGTEDSFKHMKTAVQFSMLEKELFVNSCGKVSLKFEPLLTSAGERILCSFTEIVQCICEKVNSEFWRKKHCNSFPLYTAKWLQETQFSSLAWNRRVNFTHLLHLNHIITIAVYHKVQLFEFLQLKLHQFSAWKWWLDGPLFIAVVITCLL